jgi:uncharacterized membrane protein AbrB (regulator of aidB expression)
MLPDWVLVLDAILALVGIYIGLKLIRQKLSIKKSIITNILMFLFGWFLNAISLM